MPPPPTVINGSLSLLNRLLALSLRKKDNQISCKEDIARDAIEVLKSQTQFSVSQMATVHRMCYLIVVFFTHNANAELLSIFKM